MLIYFFENTQLNVVCVMHSAMKTTVNKHSTTLNSVHSSHVELINNLKENEILVLGNASIIGNGIFSDNVMTDYTGIKSKLEPLYIPSQKDKNKAYFDIEDKYRQKRISLIIKLRKERTENMKQGLDFLDLDTIMDLGDKVLSDTLSQKKEDLLTLNNDCYFPIINKPIHRVVL